MNQINAYHQKLKPYYLIGMGNLIPLAGYIFADWDLTFIFLYYTIELCFYEMTMIPKTIVYSWREHSWDSPRKAVGIAFSWILFRILLFGLAINFLLVIAFAVSPSSGKFDQEQFENFFRYNLLAIILLGIEYFYGLIKNYFILKEYEKVPEEKQLIEITMFYMALLVPIGFLNGLFVGIEASASSWQVTVMIVLIIFKSFSQVFLRRRKIRLYLQSNS